MVIDSQLFQFLQIILFSIPVLTLFVMGLLILIRPVTTFNRKWFLLVFIPLLLANPIAIFADETLVPGDIFSDGLFWVVLGVDLVLAVLSFLALQGTVIYGVTPEQVITTLEKSLLGAGNAIEQVEGEWKTFWRVIPNATILTWKNNDEQGTCTITAQAGEVTIRAKSGTALKQLRPFLGSIDPLEKGYKFDRHAVGILYLVLAIVLAVFGWIYFFEPRLILIS